MAELNQFMEYVSDKKPNTIRTYNLQYRTLHDIIDRDIGQSSEKTVILAANTAKSINSVQALLNVGMMVRKMLGLGYKQIEKVRDNNRRDVSNLVKEKNITITDGLPSYQDLVDYVNKLYEENKWVSYVINYILLNYQTRNQDLVFQLVRLKRDIKNDGRNYMWIPQRGNKVLYVRNNYKTSGSHGKIQIEITDPKFILAMKRIIACKKYQLECGNIIPNDDQVGYHVKKLTLNQIGEGKMVKIIIDHFRGDMQKLKEISKNRGTNIETLIESYDIKNV